MMNALALSASNLIKSKNLLTFDFCLVIELRMEFENMQSRH